MMASSTMHDKIVVSDPVIIFVLLRWGYPPKCEVFRHMEPTIRMCNTRNYTSRLRKRCWTRCIIKFRCASIKPSASFTYRKLQLTMSRCTFLCQDPDFTVRSLGDGTVFQVKRTAMEMSDIFSEPSIYTFFKKNI